MDAGSDCFRKNSGLVADVDIESEKYRWMGSARFDFYVRNLGSCNNLKSLETDASHRNEFLLIDPRLWFA